MSTVTGSAARASGGVERPVTSTSMAPQIIEAIEAPIRRLLGGVIGFPFAVQAWLLEFRDGCAVEKMHPAGTNVKGIRLRQADTYPFIIGRARRTQRSTSAPETGARKPS